MPRSYVRKSLHTYPPIFFDIAQKHASGESLPQLGQPSLEVARSNQRLWHKFRSALIANQHPHAEAAIDIICSVVNSAPRGIQGRYFLEFTPRGLVNFARELKGLPPLEEEGGMKELDTALKSEGITPPPEAVSISRNLKFAQTQGVTQAELDAETQRILEEAAKKPARDQGEEFYESLLKKPVVRETDLDGSRAEFRRGRENQQERMDPLKCHHEWDATETFCLKCGEPTGSNSSSSSNSSSNPA